MRRLVPLALAAAVILGVANGGGAVPAGAQTVAACPTGVTIAVAPPAASAPTTVTATVTPAQNIKAASAGDAQSFHVHYFVDTPATAAGTVIPSGDPKIIHSGSLTQDLGALAAGSHTVTVVLGQLNHTACEARGSVTFIVAQQATPAATAAGTPAAPKTGGAGLAAPGGASAAALLAFAALALALTVGGRTLAKRRA